jgi:hypothetical protein
MDLELAGYHNAVKPDLSPDWSLQVTVKFLFPLARGSAAGRALS